MAVATAARRGFAEAGTREQLHRVRGLAALRRPLAVLLLPAGLREQLGRRLGVERDRRRRPWRRTPTTPGGTSASARRPVARRAPRRTIACRSIAPSSALRTRTSRSSGWLGAQVEQDGRERRRRVLDAGHRGIRRPAAPEIGRGEARDAVDLARAERLGGRGVVLGRSRARCARGTARRAGAAGLGIGVRERVHRRRRPPSGTSPPRRAIRATGVRSAWVSSSSVSAIRPGADRRLAKSLLARSA